MSKNKESKETLSDQITEMLSDIGDDLDYSLSDIHQLGPDQFLVDQDDYRLVVNYRQAFDLDAFKGRYVDYYSKYDFILGDWGHEKLRLKGFYRLGHRKAKPDQLISFLDEYLKEYCNFGCAYFLLAKEAALEAYDKDLEEWQTREAKKLAQAPKSRAKQRGRITTKTKTKSAKKQDKSKAAKDSFTFKNHKSQPSQAKKKSSKKLPKLKTDTQSKKRQTSQAKNGKKHQFKIKQK